MATASGKAVIGKSFQKKQVVQSKVKKSTKSHQRKFKKIIQWKVAQKRYNYVYVYGCPSNK